MAFPDTLAAVVAPRPTLEIGGRVRHLLLDFNALVLAETVTGQNLLDKGGLQGFNAVNLSALIWAALIDENPELGARSTPAGVCPQPCCAQVAVTDSYPGLALVRSWITPANIAAMYRAITETYNASLPKPDPDAEPEPDPNLVTGVEVSTG